MKFNNIKLLGSRILIVLLVINYMVITIIFNDFVAFKYLRDIVIVSIFIIWISRHRPTFRKYELIFLLFCIFLGIAFITATNKSVALVYVRRYIWPLVILWVGSRYFEYSEIELLKFSKFVYYFFAIISMWGVIQAFILGDEFLKKLGYPVVYSYGYGKMMLNSSYYFGGFGIQRVVSTFCNSNVCALALGVSLIYMVAVYPYMKMRFKNVLLAMVVVGYVLTFSRSNFLAMLIVVIILGYYYIPCKRIIYAFAIAALLGTCLLWVIQGENGIVGKLLIWVKESLTMKESSSAGRIGIWLTALEVIRNNPLGMGLGHVGSIAINSGQTNLVVGENSYFAMAIDSGIMAMIIYVIALLSIYKVVSVKNISRQNENYLQLNRMSKAVKCIIVYFMIVMFFSNHIYDMEATAIIYIYIGIFINQIGQQRNSLISKEAL